MGVNNYCVHNLLSSTKKFRRRVNGIRGPFSFNIRSTEYRCRRERAVLCGRKIAKMKSYQSGRASVRMYKRLHFFERASHSDKLLESRILFESI